MSWLEIFSVALLASLFWFWFESTRVREFALERARNQCQVNGVQFLDDTASLTSIKPGRDANGRLALQRTYTFEYSETGNDRQSGSILMLGQEVQFLDVSPSRAGADFTVH